MQPEELWDKLDEAVSNPDRKMAKAAVAALLQQAYDENLALMCAAEPDPEDPHLCEQAFLNVGKRRYFILFTNVQLFRAFYVPEHPDLRLSGLLSRDVLDDMFGREDVKGLAFNPYFDTTMELHAGLLIRKADLPFGKHGAHDSPAPHTP